MAISVNNLSPTDEISIRTQNSEYKFHVTDPTMGKGLLSGGTLGEIQREAFVWDGVITRGQPHQFSADLEIGRCAFFFVAFRDRLRRLTTSIVEDVSVSEIPAAKAAEC
jgi:hypothetical protein